MEQLNNIKKRINAVGEIRKMTKAMALISAVRMRDSREQESLSHPFVTKCALTITEIFKRSPDLVNKLLHFHDYSKDEEYPIHIYLLTGDRGLSGAFNESIVQLAERLADLRRTKLAEDGYKNVTIEMKFCGRVGKAFLRRKDYIVNEDFRFSIDSPTYYHSMDFADLVYDEARKQQAAEIYFVYCRLDTAITVEPCYTRLYPLDKQGMYWLTHTRAEREAERKAFEEKRERFDEDFSRVTSIRSKTASQKQTQLSGGSDDSFVLPFVFEGDENKVISYLVGTYMNALVYGILTESYASEQLSRMTSMDAATSNADALLTNLIRERNRYRQKQITTELTEIIGGAEAIMTGD